MRKLDYAKFVRRAFEVDILEKRIGAKGTEYTEGREDQFDNFKSGAEELHEGDKYTVHQVLTFKHLKSLRHWYRFRKTLSEAIEERILDIIAYLFLLLGMLAEDEMDACGECIPDEPCGLHRGLFGYEAPLEIEASGKLAWGGVVHALKPITQPHPKTIAGGAADAPHT